MNYLKNKKIYLSAPIQHSDDDTWKISTINVLSNRFHLNVFDPAADPKQQRTPDLIKAQKECDYATIREIGKSFVRKDLGTVDRTDFVIAHVPYKVCTTGVPHEIIHANNIKRPVLLVCTQGKQFISPWYYGFIALEFMFSSWDELYCYLEEVDKGQHKNNDRWAFVYDLV